MSLLRVSVASLFASSRVTSGLDNGAALTPPMGFNNWMAGLPSDEASLGAIADFIVSSGLQDAGYVYINSDDAWGTKARDDSGRLQWSTSAFPSGIPGFADRLHSKGLKFGIYGASTGVTCLEMPGQLYHEDVDAQTYAEWGVDYLKSDTCASYALDSSLRFAAMRDALNRTGRPIVLSIEPFSMNVDPEQSIYVSNLARIGTDIGRTVDSFTHRADISDKWSPLAGPGYWNDPDMMHVQNPPGSNGDAGLTLAENRLFMGLWSIMKAPLLLSSDLRTLQQDVLDVVSNREVIAINQDPLGVQARKLAIDGKPLPWLVGLESCAGKAPVDFYSRALEPSSVTDTRLWTAVPAAGSNDTFQLRNDNTRRCLAVLASEDAPALLPCDATAKAQQWRFDMGPHTITSITSVAAGKALAVSNSTLFAREHLSDAFQVTDSAYGYGGLMLVDPYDQDGCAHRDCQNYDPSQMWLYSAFDRKLRHATFTSSMNHKDAGDGYVLTQKQPTWRHHCLAHVLSVANGGSATGTTEVWGGPLSDGAYVAALANRGTVAANVTMRYSMFEIDALDDSVSFKVRSLWDGQDLGQETGGFEMEVGPHDIAIFKLTPVGLEDFV